MKKSNYQSYEDLPLFLNAELLAKVLGVGVSSAYELMHEKGFPSVRIGKRFIVPRDDLKRWMDEQVAKKRAAEKPAAFINNKFQLPLFRLV